MTKMTNEIRKAVVRDILVYRYQKAMQALIVERQKLTVEVWEACFSKDKQKLLREAPSSFFYKSSNFNVQVSGRTLQFYTSGDFVDRDSYNPKFQPTFYNQIKGKVPPPDPLPLPYKSIHGTVGVIDSGTPLAERVMDVFNRSDTFEKEMATARAELYAALDSFTTVEKMIQIWPDVEKFAKPFIARPTFLPATQINRMNTLLKLPPLEEKAAA